MKLFIDDIRKAPDESWHVARTVTEAIRVIYYYGHELTEISLDHDIAHFENLDETDVDQRVSACKETFAAVAYYIAERWKDKGSTAPKIVLHSANPVGVENMELILSSSGIDCSIEMRGPVFGGKNQEL